MTSSPPARSGATVGEAYVRLLGARGIDYVFANAGTDFAPVIEGWARARADGAAVPALVTVPHENVAVCMALGHWMVSGRMQAVMVHVNVGTANTLCGLLNATRVGAPMLLAAGRTPVFEADVEGARNIHIHWTQEMFDQAGMVREAVKWDYELRGGAQIETVMDRALAVAQSEPKGPVYLTLPREVLAAPLAQPAFQGPARAAAAAPPAPRPADIERLATLLAGARAPLVITSSLGFDRPAVALLAELADRHAIPVVQHVPRCLCLPASHPMHAGYDPHRWLKDADLVVVIDSQVPWIPGRARPQPGAKVVHIGTDPLCHDLPIRGFECDQAITSIASEALRMLGAALERHASRHLPERRERVRAARAAMAERLQAERERARTRSPIDPVWLTHCIDQARDERTVIVREAPQCAFAHLSCDREGSFYSVGGAGGLGWGLGAALGAKLADPESTVVAVVGDGSYMFGTPVAAHYVGLEQQAPFLTVILDNQRWNEVGAATRHLYPDGVAASDRRLEPLTYFDPRLRLEKVVETVGGHGERVTEPAALPTALRRALDVVRKEKRQAVLDVVCSS